MKFRKYILTKKNYKYVMGILNKKVENALYDIFINYNEIDTYNNVHIIFNKKIKFNFNNIDEDIKIFTTNKDIIIKDKFNRPLIEMIHTEDEFNILDVIGTSLINISSNNKYITYDNDFNIEGEDIDE